MVRKFDSAMRKRTKYIPLGIIPCTPHSFVKKYPFVFRSLRSETPFVSFFLVVGARAKRGKKKNQGKKTFLNLRSARNIQITAGKGQDVWLPFVLITVLAGLHNCFTQIVSKEDIIKYYENSNFVNKNSVMSVILQMSPTQR